MSDIELIFHDPLSYSAVQFHHQRVKYFRDFCIGGHIILMALPRSKDGYVRKRDYYAERLDHKVLKSIDPRPITAVQRPEVNIIQYDQLLGIRCMLINPF